MLLSQGSQNILQSGDLDDETRTKVLAICFGKGPYCQTTNSQGAFRKFMNHYTSEPKHLTYGCRQGSYPISSLNHVTHQDIVEVIGILCKKKNQTRLEILQDTTTGPELSSVWRSQSVGDK